MTAHYTAIVHEQLLLMTNFVSICFPGLESVSFSAWVKSNLLFQFYTEKSISFQLCVQCECQANFIVIILGTLN